MGTIRVLHVFGGMYMGGAETRTMEIYRTIDKIKIQFDFLVHTDEKCHYDEEIIALGGKIYCIPKFNIFNTFKYIKEVNRFFTEHREHHIIHGHMTSTGAIYHYIAKKHNIPIRIAHARAEENRISVKLLRPILNHVVTNRLSVSKVAGISIFGKNNFKIGIVKVLPNAIDVEKYSFNDDIRKYIRKKMNLEGKNVIGHIGRFHEQKNHMFLLDVFNYLYKCNNNVILLLIGQGELESKIKKRIDELKIGHVVRFLGKRTDVAKLLQAIDIFVFPSLYEGLPGTVLEAQAAGLDCLISDKIAEEVKLTPLVEFLSIDEAPIVWADRINEILTKDKKRRSWNKELVLEGFDISTQAQNITDFYEELIKGIG